MKLSDLTARTKPLTIEISGLELHLDVRPSAITPRMVAESARLSKVTDDPALVAEAMDYLARAVSKLVASWSLKDDDGQPYPTDVESVSELPIEFLNAVIAEAMGSLGEASAPTSGATSDAPSSRVVKLDRSRTGTH